MEGIMKAFLFTSVGAFALMSVPVHAQDQVTGAQTNPPATVDAGSSLEEIIVTAQRRSERLQDVPVTVVAATAARLAAVGIRSSQDLSIVTPGLSVPQTSGYSQPRIRGVGTSSNGPGIENPVATYIDGVYIASAPSSLLTLNNIERVEVLKGPQGTLFGRNATGGLIQIITKDPSHTAGATANLTYGNYEQIVADAYVTGALSSNLAADAAVRYEHQGKGYGHNLFDGSEVGRVDHDFAGRIKFLFEPSDTTTVRLGLDYASRADDQYIQHLSTQYPGTFNNAFFGGPFPLGGAYDVNIDFPFKNRLESGGAALQIDHDFGGAALKSITAYRKSKFEFNLDLDYLPIDGVFAHSSSEFEQFSQELQLSSKNDGPLSWVAGLYYFHSNEGWLPLTIGFGPLLSPIPGVPLVNSTNSRQKTDSFAGYGQATYEIAQGTRLTLGGRFTYEDKRGSGLQTVTAGGAVIAAIPLPAPDLGIPDKINFKRFNYRIALDHKFTPDIMGYLSFNTGFKSGGYVLASPTVEPYKPEDIKAAEAGLKTQLFDRHLRLNAAGFYYSYKNIQVQRFDSGTIVVYNGAKAELYGLDLDGEVLLARGLTLNGGFSYIHGRFKSFPNADFIVPVGGCIPAPGGVCSASAAGNRLPATPTTTLNIGGNYEVDTNFGKLAFNVTYYRSGKFYAASDNVLLQKSYDLVNASIAWTDLSDHLTIRVWGKNLGKTIYANSILEGFSGGVRSLGLPRTYGVTAGFKF
jgi:iron complex outermembrane recepter protein